MYKMIWIAFLVGCLLICSCAVPSPEESCEDVCQDLFMECGFPAFPDKASCTTGCLYESSEGGQVATLQECVAEAKCDIFSVIECQNAFGAEK